MLRHFPFHETAAMCGLRSALGAPGKLWHMRKWGVINASCMSKPSVKHAAGKNNNKEDKAVIIIRTCSLCTVHLRCNLKNICAKAPLTLAPATTAGHTREAQHEHGSFSCIEHRDTTRVWFSVSTTDSDYHITCKIDTLLPGQHCWSDNHCGINTSGPDR